MWTGHGLTVLKTKKKVGSKEGDFISLINIFLRYTHAKQGEKKRVCSELKVSQHAMERATKIHDQLVAQVKKLSRFKNAEEEM